MDQLGSYLNNKELTTTAIILTISSIASFLLFHRNFSKLLIKFIVISIFVGILQYLILNYNFGSSMQAVMIVTIILEVISWIWNLYFYYGR